MYAEGPYLAIVVPATALHSWKGFLDSLTEKGLSQQHAVSWRLFGGAQKQF